MTARKATIGIALVALLPVLPLLQAVQLNGFSGAIAGEVKSPGGIVQMGASVILYNRYDRVIRQASTDSKGSFTFDALMPDLYSVRVSLASFVPAFKRNIAVQPGIQSMLTINLASMLSSIELVNPAANGSLMTEDWKWVLRSAQSTRPILRFRDDPTHARYSAFSDTRGMVSVSAGDGFTLSSTGSQPDLGTAFVLATSLYGSNQFQVSGNMGYSARTGLPTAGFRTSYSHLQGTASGPEITVTMRQISLPLRGGFAPTAGAQTPPALRTLATSIIDEFTVLDNLKVEYGMSAETVSLFNRLNTISPFARLTYDFGGGGTLQIGYSSGAAPLELITRGNRASAEPSTRDNAELQQDLVALAALPRVSMRDGRAHVQRTNNLEIGYRKTAGSRTYSAGVFREDVRNGALTMAGGGNNFAGDLIPDLGSRSSVFDVGNFSRWGYVASVSQAVTDRIELSVFYGRGGALTTGDSRTLTSDDADALRSMVKVAERNWATARIAGTTPGTGTHFAASYGWADYRSLMPSHTYLTQKTRPEPGLNLSVRQPIPSFGLVPGRFEASADLRNLLEQGYLPINTLEGRQILLTNSPRALRGGLSFIF